MEEDFDNNNFYIYLQKNFRNLYEDAQSRRYTICLPCNNSVVGAHFDLNFVEHHILKPSPFFKGEYHTINFGEPKVVQIDGRNVTTGEGFSEKRHVNIIGEETGYNKDYASYRILLVDQTFYPVYIDKTKINVSTPPSEHAKERIHRSECREFLHNLPGCEGVIRQFQEDIKLFQKNYYVVKGYLDDASDKLNGIYKQYSQEFQQHTENDDEKVVCKNSRFIHNVNNSVESYILEETYQKIFPVVCSQCGSEEQAFIRKLGSMKGVKGSELGLKQEYLCDMKSCVQILGQVEGLITPLEILSKLKEVLDDVSKTLTAHINSLHSITKTVSDLPCITTDEIIPLLVLVIVECQPTTLISNLYYVEHFHWCTSALDNLSFSLVSFRAAVQYIQTTNFEEIKADRKLKANKASDEVKSTPPETTPQEPVAETVKGVQFDRQLQRINKMFQTTAIDNTSQYFANSVPLRNRSSQKKAKLGDFLNSLQEDGLPTCYGKQN